jgi:beta-galactosidase
MVDIVYRSLFETGVSVEFVFNKEQISQYKVLILPRHIMYEPGLEEELIEFVNSGGTLVVTNDLFAKNEDNVYLTYVPDIYKILLDWHENDLIEENMHDRIVLAKNKPGKGNIYMVNKDLTLDGWKTLWQDVII